MFSHPQKSQGSHEKALYPLLKCQNLYSKSLKAPYRSNLLNLLMASGSGVSCFPKYLLLVFWVFLVFIPFYNLLIVGMRFTELCRQQVQGSQPEGRGCLSVHFCWILYIPNAHRRFKGLQILAGQGWSLYGPNLRGQNASHCRLSPFHYAFIKNH